MLFSMWWQTVGPRIPKCLRKQRYGEVAKYLGSIFRELAKERESSIAEGHICPGPCAYADRDTAEILGSPSGGVYQREKRDSDRRAICGEAKKVQRTKLLGERVA
jgi:hypothetical protein